MRILALDLGKYKTVACEYEAQTGRQRFVTVLTTPKALHDLIVDREPHRVVIEICSIAGWVSELVRSLGIELQVANTSDERWQWRKVKTKNDRSDALKLAQLSAVNQLRLVHVPPVYAARLQTLPAFLTHLNLIETRSIRTPTQASAECTRQRARCLWKSTQRASQSLKRLRAGAAA